ncbi:F0F1 ATP synthase subunit alpha [Buchnera aphidicola]|uniref:F0F1 ATP synthase subunit alpha n=1 Tax=Buchnera aphidicola TaxID=9 RepID=UPI0031B8407E
MKLNTKEISELIQKRIKKFNIVKSIYNEGKIISVIDGIIKINGLSEVMQGEMLYIDNNSSFKQFAIALNLEIDLVGAIVLGSFENITEGMLVRCTGKILEIPVGYNFLGRVINALAQPIDGKGKIISKNFFPVENIAPGVIDRKRINKPIQTGYKAIDSMIPIGKGQRELIIGDRQTGKTSLAIDTIINQRKNNVFCIYVAIGQKISTVLNIVKKLDENKALKNTIIIVASASESASLQYLSPYVGCSMGEYFRNKGKDALIVYDDLTKHAISYRQISLLLRRPPGREGFPGDIFYLHSRLLERASNVTSKYINYISKGKINKKSGSLTALPIIETQEGDVSSFVPTNVISITDGQIFLESNLFNSGIRPAVNPGLSVSRVGSAAQTKIIKILSSKIRTLLAQYRELSSFSQFSSDLDKVTKKQLIHGKKLIEILKQKQYLPMSIAEQALILFASEKGFLKNIDIKKIKSFEKKILFSFKKKHKKLIKKINIKGEYNKKIKKKLFLFLKKFTENNK